MDSETEPGQASERRETPTVHLEIDPDPRRLRDSLDLVDGATAALERDCARRVRLLIAEVVGRSSDSRRRPHGLIRLDISVQPSAIRIEASGGALMRPSDSGGPEPGSGAVFPHWVLDGLADRWGLDRRRNEPTIWFLVNRNPD